MSREEFRAREKKTHKMTRDGLVERSAESGEQKRVSSRTADFSLKQKDGQGESPARPSPPGKSRPQPKRDGEGNLSQEPLSPYEALEEAEPGPSMRQGQDGKPLRPDKSRARPGKAAKRKTVRPFAEKEAEAAAPEDAEDYGRLSFQKKEEPAAPGAKAQQKKKTRQRFQFDRQEQTKEEREAARQPVDSRRQKKAEKAGKQAEKKEKALHDAKQKLPTRKRLVFSKEFDPQTGKLRRGPHIQTETKPMNAREPVKQTAKAAVQAPAWAVWQKGHQKIHQAERDNVGVEAAHKTEERAERLGWAASRYHKRRQKQKPYRLVRKLERQSVKANVNAAYQRAMLEHPELEQKTLAKWIQKQKIKRQYVKAAKQAEHTAQTIRTAKDVFVQTIRAIAHFCGAHKAVIGMVAVGGLLFVMLSSVLGSCGAMFSGAGTSTFAASYTADDTDINASDLYYSELETDLEYEISRIEETHPGYDEYRYNVGEIGHNAYELMAYLSAMYDFFTFSEIQPVLDSLFSEQYDLQLIEETETRTDSEGEEYEWHILNIILTVTPMEQFTLPELEANDSRYKYDVYQQTYGNRQNYGNPFDFSWLAYVTSPYGYRIHPMTGEKDLHTGIDIAVPGGTPILAIHDGTVISAGSAGDYGLCVVIEDERGYRSRYAHCSSLDVSAGQEVKKGDAIAAVGSTGNSTGPHLHLEVTHNGEYLNPFYFVDNGDDGSGAAPGTPGGPVIPDYSGEPMGDGSFAAMLSEAEKFIGYPYVWGGSSPSTSFDCSGYVSWVINQSGVGSVGRQTAGGLYGLSTPVSRENARPGDLIFFTKTYSSPGPVSHVGIYVGGGKMLHCGDPIGYADINSAYWTEHFYAFGRIGG